MRDNIMRIGIFLCYSTQNFVLYKIFRECQVDTNEHFRHLLLFAFNRGVKAAKAIQEICSVYGENAMPESTAYRWFSRFKNKNFDLKDGKRTGRPVKFDEERLNQLIRDDPRQTTRELVEQMNCHHSTVADHLHSMGKGQKLGKKNSHDLTQNSIL